MYAVIETGGKQYKVKEGDIVFVEKLSVPVEESIDFAVVALHDGKALRVGAPVLEDAKVLGKVLKQGKGKKITVFTYKPKKSSKRKLGHRQPYTQVQIEAIQPKV